MLRYWPALLVFTFANPAAGDGTGSALQEIESLDYLLEAPLPGETNESPERASEKAFDDLWGKPVTRVVESKAQAGFNPVAESGIPLGALLDAALTRRAVKRLWDTGNYSNIRIFAKATSGGGVELLIDVELMLRVRRLDVLGNNALDDEQVARAVEYVPDRTILADPEVLRRLKMKLLDAYSVRGFREVRANLRIETTGEPGGVALVVEVDEGRPERYVRIGLPGLPESLDERLFLRLTGIEEGMLRAREDVEKKVSDLSERLALEGYRDAKVKQFRERRLHRYGFELNIPIEPGIRTGFRFAGNEYFRATDLEKVLTGESPLSTSPEVIDQGIKRIKEHLRANGFFHARIRSARICIDPGAKPRRISTAQTCPAGFEQQVLEFEIAEGPPVEVARIDFSGNEYFSNKALEGEVFAFVKEQMESKEVFQPLNAEIADNLGVSGKKPDNRERRSGGKSPRHKRARVFVPKIYREAMEHLATIYQEQGFLGVDVTDTCDISKRKSFNFRGMRFLPIDIHRADETAEGEGKAKRPCVYINEELNMFVVAVSIKEGPQTRLNEIAFEGNRVFAARTLQEVGELSISDPYNEYRLRESAQTIVEFYKDRGYMFAEAYFDKSFSQDMERAKVVLRIKEGPEVRAGNIRIEGAEMTSRRLIGERLTFETGDLLTPDEIDESQQRLMELGVLSSATVQMVSPDAHSSVKNIKIQVTESDPQYLELSGGIATIEGLRGGFEYGYRNLAGWALNARLRARANYRLFFFGSESPVIAAFEDYYDKLDLSEQIEHHILAGLGQPHFPGTRGLLGWGMDLIHERVNEPAFSATRSTGFLRLNSTHAMGKIYRRAIVLEARGGVEDSKIKVLAVDQSINSEEQTVNPLYLGYLRIPEGESIFLVTGLKATVDFRDHPFNPTKGMLFSVGGDLVRSLAGFDPEYYYSDATPVENIDDFADSAIEHMLESGEIYKIPKLSKLIRAEADLSFYVPFGQTGVVLAVSFSGGYVFHLSGNSTTWADRYFYAGGIDTLRGFPEESMVPEDLYQKWKASLQDSSDEANVLLRSSGGEAMFIARAEFRYPLAKGFVGAIFGEAGNLWRDRKKMNLMDLDPLAIHLRPVAGGGIRYITPLGPLSFDLGANLMQRPHEEPFAWFFSIGTAF